MLISFGVTIFVLISLLVLGILVYFKNPKGKINILFAILVFWMMVWAISNFLENESVGKNLAILFLMIDFSSASILVYFWLLFCLNFPQPLKPSKLREIVLFIPAIIFAGFSFSNLIIYNIGFGTKGIEFDFGILYPFYVIYILCYVIIGGGGSLILRYKRTGGIQRTQILYVLLGFLLTASITATINLFFQRSLPVELFRIGVYGAVFLIGFTAYAIIKKKLFEIRVVSAAIFIGFIIILLFFDTLLFTEDFFMRIFKGVILFLFLGFGYLLIKSILKEIKYREEVARAYEVEKHAHQELKRLDEAKSQFIMATQHHLRTPLTSMQGYLDLLFGGTYGKVPEKIKEIHLKFQISTQRLIKVVNELLDISQFQLGKEVVSLKEKVQIESLLKEVIEELQFEAKAKGLYLKLEKPEEKIPEIKADPEKLKVALFNIVDNGIKYTHKGGVIIKFKIKDLRLQIIVQDTGVGIAPEDLKTLFSGLFERGEKAKKLYTTGRGIGLYIASKIIEAHKGKIWAESEGEGKKSTFFVELPVG